MMYIVKVGSMLNRFDLFKATVHIIKLQLVAVFVSFVSAGIFFTLPGSTNMAFESTIHCKKGIEYQLTIQDSYVAVNGVADRIFLQIIIAGRSESGVLFKDRVELEYDPQAGAYKILNDFQAIVYSSFEELLTRLDETYTTCWGIGTGGN
jgi:hypothetical protein